MRALLSFGVLLSLPLAAAELGAPKARPNADARNPAASTTLLDAVWAGRADLVQLLLDRGANIDSPRPGGGSTPLDYAVLRDDPAMSRLLLARGADPNAEYPSGVTPLQLAASRGEVALMQVLVDAGANVRHRDKAGSSPMDEAASRGNLSAVRFLAEHGAAIDGPDPYTGATPLNEAACRGDADVISFLLKHGADPARRDSTGATALENAVRFRRADAAHALIAFDRGTTGRESGLLDEAVLRGDADTVRLLIAAGADPEARGSGGSAPLDDAALKGYTAIARILLDSGAKVDSRNVWGATPLHDAALTGQTETAALLIAHGADVNAREIDSGSTPLYSAAAMGHEKMVALLLARGARPDIRNKTGATPARAAIENGFASVAQVLRGARPINEASAAALKTGFERR